MTSLPSADLTVEDGTPRSSRFGDVYYSAADGFAEAWHVFVEGNDLPRRFAALREGQTFTIGELGFGTGLNVAAALLAFYRRDHDRGRLAIWSVEGFPVPRERFRSLAEEAAERWAEAAPVLRALAAAYPDPVPGQAALRIEAVDLVLSFGEVRPSLQSALLRADAWFLDGFAPSRNPDMWSEAVMRLVGARSAIGATAATFTVAGAVRRGLQAAGFDTEKTPGFGRKREMTRARLLRRPSEESVPAPLRLTPLLGVPAPEGPVAILGAGIAGASLAWHLRRAGREVVLFDPNGAASGASGNPVGLVTPRLEAGGGWAARFYRDAYRYALSLYEDAASAALSTRGADIAADDARAAKTIATGLWPEAMLRLEREGLRADGAAALRPAMVVRALIGDTPLLERTGTLSAGAGGWRVGADGPFAAAVVACGPDAAALGGLHTELSASDGQIDLFGGPAPARVLSGRGYAAPYEDGVAVGATYAPGRIGARPAPSADATEENEARGEALLGSRPSGWRAAVASQRAVTPDRHPVAGPLFDRTLFAERFEGLRTGRVGDADPPYAEGLFVLSGLGSRGLSAAPLLAAHLSALITGGPSPLDAGEASGVHPARFLMRRMKRGDAERG
ncbi:tRNA (5-methylaminomethyl-2-thiouridine)(34)-methyltransferase MnmD [Parvularcula dongshanensis]|uniref:tRNA 5-methylaminomethyl-2-thiouridine biosynthesis bifunctional protein MnmC n=1 Tax=Parvularcula dongshanensis TaxID=1173995 RepID=A0A840I230_9PROT|nr:tRNA 5-methylaminomethyl-2-thiouridine biosynthesis bifunctional protein [Parvularcula dongshanensis]